MSLTKVLTHKMSIVDKVKAQLINPLFHTYLKLDYSPENEDLLRNQVFQLDTLKNKSPFVKLSDVPMKHVVGSQEVDFYTYSIKISRKSKQVPVYYNENLDRITIKDITGDVEQFKYELIEVCEAIFKEENLEQYFKIAKNSKNLIITKPFVQETFREVDSPKLSQFWFKTIRLILQESIIGKSDGYYEHAVKDFNYEGVYKQMGETIMKDWAKNAMAKKINLDEKAQLKELKKSKEEEVVVKESTILPEVFIKDLQESFEKKI
ncbi:hypothetical protein ACO0OL_001171 [Hanseniaspora opuntiae]